MPAQLQEILAILQQAQVKLDQLTAQIKEAIAVQTAPGGPPPTIGQDLGTSG